MAPRLAWQVIDGEAVVIDLGKGRTVGLNPTGSFVWSLLADHDEEEIAREVARRFEVTPDAARQDVHEFLTAMRDQGLLVEAG
jgi:Coenzyme PQQ synthesis protein D (PqqD)